MAVLLGSPATVEPLAADGILAQLAEAFGLTAEDVVKCVMSLLQVA